VEGKLYLCGTPIGNLEDITYRAVSTLKACDVVFAEDTRHSVRLLNHLEIRKPLYSYHEHNMETAGPEIVRRVREGETVALVTDAGMPGISDPGEQLVALFIEEGLPFEVIPGVTAFTTALVGSGLKTGQFVFEGFLSRDKRQKKKHVERLKNEWRTLIFYEAPHRLKETLNILNTVLGGDRQAVVARELTKRYEEYRRDSLSELYAYYSEQPPKGEIVLLVEGISQEQLSAEQEAAPDIPENLYDHYELLCRQGLDGKAAMKQVASARGIKKSEVYAAVLAHKTSDTL
jgi:16S rRNA (cytidine1402-2'-O)-methyltransferase